MQWLWRFYAWYDQVREPWRFLLMLVMTAWSFVFLYNEQYVWLRVVGLVYIAVLVFTRMAWVYAGRGRGGSQKGEET